MPNSKRKGNAGENAWAHWLTSQGIKASRNPMSGGSIWKGDVGNALGCCMEVKTVKRINLQEAWRQVNRDAGMSHTIPLLVLHFDNMPKDHWLMVMDNFDWLEMVTSEEKVETVKEQPRELMWSVDKAARACKELLAKLKIEYE